MDPVLRDILTAVRDGRLDPTEAARRLRRHGDAPAGADAPEPSSEPSDSVWAEVTDDVVAGPEKDKATEAGPETFVHIPVVVDDRATTGLRIRAITR
ncbi:MAG: hypothetical protein WKH47_05505, partial [Actinomycetes bacterium]